MSKMSEVYAELLELGSDTIYEIEKDLNNDPLLDVSVKYQISISTMWMIEAGASTHEMSKMVRKNEEENT